MKINQLYTQIRAMVNYFHTQIRSTINKVVFTAVLCRKMFHCSYIGRMVNKFNAQIGAVVNYLNPAVQWECLSVRLTCYGTGILVYCKFAKVYGLSVGGIANQYQSEHKKILFHSVQTFLKVYLNNAKIAKCITRQKQRYYFFNFYLLV